MTALRLLAATALALTAWVLTAYVALVRADCSMTEDRGYGR